MEKFNSSNFCFPDMSSTFKDIREISDLIEDDLPPPPPDPPTFDSAEFPNQQLDWGDKVTEEAARGDWELPPPAGDNVFTFRTSSLKDLERAAIESELINLIAWIYKHTHLLLDYRVSDDGIDVLTIEKGESLEWENPKPEQPSPCSVNGKTLDDALADYRELMKIEPPAKPVPETSRESKTVNKNVSYQKEKMGETEGGKKPGSLYIMFKNGIRFEKRTGHGTLKISLDTPGITEKAIAEGENMNLKDGLKKALKKSGIYKALALKADINNPIWPKMDF
ncbi:phosphoprotein [Inhangapi virus]|uniref:P n=1 Tax=Inhangapi virus TaxID=1620892 RepID=A0A0D3R0Z6_9RHAB|nr:P [Inhangapi virus] [Inhangapi virus]YP_010796337.1 phosphoprotein [Inhangapi virus]AJR28344.1 phosphoprotein [Inhangapi virus]ALJ94018.1 P [Inhangapi virus] [Inhangapi virus]